MAISDNRKRIQKRWRDKHPEATRAYAKQWRIHHPTASRDYRRRKLPTPTRPCPELCESGCGRRAKCLDHDHTSNTFRGWLCVPCNAGLGGIGDNLASLIRMINYLLGGSRE